VTVESLAERRRLAERTLAVEASYSARQKRWWCVERATDVLLRRHVRSRADDVQL
jgi:hypothetical protein